MNQDPNVRDSQRFLGDRYDRLLQGTEVVAKDPVLVGAPAPLDSSGLRTFASALVDRRLLDQLSERDADHAVAVLLLDFYLGPSQIAWRIHQLLSASRINGWKADNLWAVVAVFTAALTILTERIGSVHNMIER